MTIPDFAKTWLAQRERGANRLAAIERAELAALDDTTALAHSEALLAATPLDLGPRDTSGFVEQQRLFARARRR